MWRNLAARCRAFLAPPRAPHPQQPLLFNLRVEDDYRLGRKLGSGSFGSVHRAVCRVTGDEVAVKTVRKDQVPDHKALAELADEIRIMHRLRHPNVRNLVGFYEDEEMLHIVSDLCKGGELFHRIAGRGHLTEIECAGIVRQILSALAHCHAAGIVHRDIKPENLLFRTPRGASQDDGLRDIVLVDFGLAHLAAGQSGSGSGGMHGRAGSPYYMAPECVRGEQYDASVDIWAVGAVTFQCLTGYPPFLGKDADEIFANVLKGNIRYTWPEFDECGSLAVPFLQSLLVADPAARPTAEEALKHPWLDAGRQGDLRSDVLTMPQRRESAKRLRYRTGTYVKQK